MIEMRDRSVLAAIQSLAKHITVFFNFAGFSRFFNHGVTDFTHSGSTSGMIVDIGTTPVCANLHRHYPKASVTRSTALESNPASNHSKIMGFGDTNIFLPEGESFAPDPARVDAIDQLIRDQPLHLAEPIANREAWKGVARSQSKATVGAPTAQGPPPGHQRVKPAPIGDAILAAAEELLSDHPLPYLTNELYRHTMESRNREQIDPVLKRFRARLGVLVLAEAITDNGRYLPQIETDIRALAEVRAWNFPLHPEAAAFYEGEGDFLDLHSSTYAANLVHTLHILEDRLSPEICDLIRSEVDRRVFQTFEKRIISGQDVYWWVTVTHNWNSVCLANILACALRLKEDRRDRAWYVAVVEKLIQYSEAGFEESGFYTEGVGYWVFGFSHYLLAAEMVRLATGGAIDWLKKPKIQRVAAFGRRMEIQDGIYPAFADCNPTVQPPDCLSHWLNNRIDPTRVHRQTDREIEAVTLPNTVWATFADLLLFHQVDLEHACAPNETLPLRDWFEDVQYLICRPAEGASPRLAATFKGGHNGVNHSHNDLGTFTVQIGRHTLIADPGKETYTDRTFSQHRYQSNLLNSFGHPVPVLGGHLQRPGKDEHRAGYGSDFFATVLATEFSTERDRVVLELKEAYQLDFLQKLQREFVYHRKSVPQIIVTDEVAFTRPETFETALTTFASWELPEQDRLILRIEDTALEVRVHTDDGLLEFSHCQIQESATPHRLAWKFKDAVTAATVRLTITPL